MAGTTVELNDLSDHDLLITIAGQTRCLPEMEQRLRAVEQEIIALKVKGSIMAVIITAVSSVVGSIFPLGGRP